MSEAPTHILKCPGCGKPVPWTQSNPHRPFCSERCRLIDFGGWASETHRITGDDSDLSSPEEGD